jgi:hypothetical protein
LPGVSDAYSGEPNAWATLIERCHESGARAISFEYIFINPAPTDRQKAMYRLMFKSMGNPKFGEMWQAASKAGAKCFNKNGDLYYPPAGSVSCRRGSRSYKYDMTIKVRDKVHSLGWAFGCSDPHFKEFNDYGCCCFSGDTEIFIRKQQSPRISRQSFLRLYQYCENGRLKDFEILHNGEWKIAKLVRVDYNRKWYRIYLRNGTRMFVTDDHIHITNDREKTTTDLKIGDYILISNIGYQDDEIKRGDYDLGRFVGLYLAEGSGANRDDKKGQFSFCFGAHEGEFYTFIKDFIERLGGYVPDKEKTIQNNYLRVNCYSWPVKKLLSQFIIGKDATSKKLREICFSMSVEFRTGLLDGWMDGDGRIRKHRLGATTSSNKLIQDMYSIAVSIGRVSSISVQKRTNNNFHKLGKSKPGRKKQIYQLGLYVGDIKNSSRKCKNNEEIYFQKVHNINGSLYSQIIDIKVELNNRAKFAYCVNVPDGNRFQLANGIITHNCGISPDHPRLGNWSRKQLTNVMVEAYKDYQEVTTYNNKYKDTNGNFPEGFIPKKQKQYIFNSWNPDWAKMIRTANCISLGDWHTHRKLKPQTFSDVMRKKWNDVRHPRGPFMYFGGMLYKVGEDLNTKDFIYEYRPWDEDFDEKFIGE